MSGVPHIGGFAAPATADHATLGYTGSNLTTVVYRQGGASGTVVGTLNLTYDGSNNVTAVYWSLD